MLAGAVENQFHGSYVSPVKPVVEIIGVGIDFNPVTPSFFLF
jgi:hypothetical protein